MHGRRDISQTTAHHPVGFILLGIALALAWSFSGCSTEEAVIETPAKPALGASEPPPPPTPTNEGPAQTPVESAADRLTELTESQIERSGWTFGGANGEIIQTPHYEILSTLTDRSSGRRRIKGKIPYFFEKALAHYVTALGDLPLPEARMKTYVFDNNEQWRAKTRQLLPQQAASFNSLGRGGYATGGAAVMWYIGSRDTLAIAAHEGWHQYTQSTFKHRLPVWLEEGVATYMEGFTTGEDGLPQFRPRANSERWSMLRRASRRGWLIPLSELLSSSPQSFLGTRQDALLVYYAQVWALTRYLAEGEDGRYRPALEEVLADAAHGRLVGRLGSSEHITSRSRRRQAARSVSGPWLLMEYFNDDLETFEEGYLAYIESLVQPGRRFRSVSRPG